MCRTNADCCAPAICDQFYGCAIDHQFGTIDFEAETGVYGASGTLPSWVGANPSTNCGGADGEMTLFCASILPTELAGQWELRALYGNVSDEPQTFTRGQWKQTPCGDGPGGCDEDLAVVLHELFGPAGFVPPLEPRAARFLKHIFELDIDENCPAEVFYEADGCCRVTDILGAECPPESFLSPPNP